MGNITAPYIESFIRDLLPNETGVLNMIATKAREDNIPIIHPEVASFLNIITKISASKKILEIGTAIGYSSILLCKAAGRGGHVTTIERNDQRANEALLNIGAADLSNNIRVIIGDAQEVLTFLTQKYDLIFLDGAKGHYRDMVEKSIHLLKCGGVLISDNILFQGMVANDSLVIRRKRTIVNRMRDYLSYICNHPELDTSIILIGDGVAISYKGSEVCTNG